MKVPTDLESELPGWLDLLKKAKRAGGKTSVGRYAPSPTGPLHLGNLRSGLLAWLQCRLIGGRFVLRMEDLDRPRTRPGAAQSILQDLRWLGLDWDEGPDVGGDHGPYNQSERDFIYQRALEFLDQQSLIFPCYCSRKDIQQASSAPHGHDGPLYPGTCRSEAGRNARRKQRPGRRPAFRLRVEEDQPLTIEDRLAGPVTQTLTCDVGDFVLRRTDGLFAYQLAVVVDDILMGVTDVLRGDDLLDSSHRQHYLFKLLGADPPIFWHVPLLHDEAGKRLSKRDGSKSAGEYREQGTRPETLIGKMAFDLGLLTENKPTSAQQLLASLNLTKFQTALRRNSK